MASAREILSNQHQSVNWVIDELLPVGLNLTGGAPKSGKSWLFLQVAQAVASGESFLGYKTKPGGVVYFALEDSIGRLAERMKLQGWDVSKLKHPVTFYTMDDIDGSLLDSPLGPPPKGTSLVIIDTLSAAFAGSQVSHGKVRELFIDLRDYAHEHQVCVVVVDHLNKSGSILGSMAKLAFADSIWTLDKGRLGIDGKDTKIDGVNVELVNGIWKETEEVAEEVALYKDLMQTTEKGVYTIIISQPRNGRVTVEVGQQTTGFFGTKTKVWRDRMQVSHIVALLNRSMVRIL